MDLKMILTIFTLTSLLLMADGQSKQITPTPTNTSQPSTSGTNCSCPTATYPPPTCSPCPSTQPPAPSLGLLSVNWTGVCEGEVVVLLRHSASYHVCHSKDDSVKTLLSGLCESRKECEGPPSPPKEGKDLLEGYNIKDMEKEEKSCKSLTLKCNEVGDQLRAYKVVVALLCCVLILLFLIRFTRPTVKALQSRLSDRRQNRWVGPTQSHSVSYHQRKAATQNQDKEKRLSYPALERLTVSDSREPSSNRNSGYTF